MVNFETTHAAIEAAIGIDWNVIVAAFLGSGVATAVMTWALKEFSEKKQQAQNAKYLAHEIAVVCERFAITVANCLSDDAVYTRHENHGYDFGHPLMRIPKFPELPKSPNYFLLPPDLRDEILHIHDHVELDNQHLEQAAEQLDGEEVNEYAVRWAKACANEAVSLADRFREKYELGSRELSIAGRKIREEIE